MWRYLSFGGGVNSVALYLLLRDQEVQFEAVYANHGADYPEVMEYVEMMQKRGYPITILDTGDLYGKCVRYSIMPSRFQRWCTQDFKVTPLRAHFQRPATVYLGISAEEAHRAKPSGDDTLEHAYPLVEQDIDREGCKRIIEAYGLPLPRKSTCYICPFQAGRDFARLRVEHPDLFERAVAMENAFIQRRIAQGKQPVYLRGEKPLTYWGKAGQTHFFDGLEQGLTPCLCEL